MSSNDNMIRGQSSGRRSVQSIQLEKPPTAGGPASVLASYDSVLAAQRLDSSQPPNAPKEFRASSPDSIFPHEGASAGSLQNRLYDAGSPVIEPPVRQHRYTEEETPEGKDLRVTPAKETRINPPRVEHTESNGRAIDALKQPIQSMVRHYCGDSEETQVRALKLIIEHHGEICTVERRERAGGASGGVESLTCLLCPPTSDGQAPRFKQKNATRTFAEHLTHEHLHIAKPFICFDAACSRAFPYSQDRDRHEKQLHKMYRPKAYDALLKKRERKQRGMPPVHKDNPQSPAEFIEYVAPTEANHQTATPDSHHLISPSSKRRTARSRSRDVGSSSMLKSKTPMPNHRVEPYTPPHARSRSSGPYPSQERHRNVSPLGSSDNSATLMFSEGVHRTIREPPLLTDDCGLPIMTGTESHMFRASSPQSFAPFSRTEAIVGGVKESRHAAGGTQTQMSHVHYSAQTTMFQPGSNMGSNPPPIDLTMPSSIGFQVPSTSVHAFTPSLQPGDYARVVVIYERPQGDLTYGFIYGGMQKSMPPLTTHTWYQHDNYGITGSTQLQPSHHGYVGSTMYQAHPQQSLQDGSLLYSSFHQNTSTSSSPWPRPQISTTVTLYTTPHPAQVPVHGASSYATYSTPFGDAHGTNADELDTQFLQPSTSNSSSHYTTCGGAGTSQYNPFYADINNSSQQW